MLFTLCYCIHSIIMIGAIYNNASLLTPLPWEGIFENIQHSLGLIMSSLLRKLFFLSQNNQCTAIEITCQKELLTDFFNFLV